MDKFSFLGSAHSSMIEEMYSKYLTDPKSINHTWSDFFQGLNLNPLYELLVYKLGSYCSFFSTIIELASIKSYFESILIDFSYGIK